MTEAIFEPYRPGEYIAERYAQKDDDITVESYCRPPWTPSELKIVSMTDKLILKMKGLI